MSLINTKLRKIKDRVKKKDKQVILNIGTLLLKANIMDLRVSGFYPDIAMSQPNLSVNYFLNITQFYHSSDDQMHPVIFQQVEVGKQRRFGRSYLFV